MNPRTRRTPSGFLVTDIPAISAVTGRRAEEQGREDPERRRLAGAVRTDQPEDLAGIDVEVDAGDRERAVVSLDQTHVRTIAVMRSVPSIGTSKWNPRPRTGR